MNPIEKAYAVLNSVDGYIDSGTIENTIKRAEVLALIGIAEELRRANQIKEWKIRNEVSDT